MLNIPPEIFRGFIALLERRDLPSAQHNYYKKWLRYYLDFCAKYRLKDTSSNSLAQFLSKLREKKQTEAQVKQAAHAVSLYLDLRRRSKAASTSDGAKPLSTAGDGASPYLATPFVPGRQSSVAEGPIQTSAIAHAPWERAIDELVAVIKTKHYSPKTLKSYGHWARKLRDFRKDREPSSLSSEDVKEFLP